MKTAAIFCTNFLLAIAFSGVAAAQEAPPRASVRLIGASLRASLDSLMRWFSVSIIYADRDVDGKVVSTSCADCTLEESLNGLLVGTSLTWVRWGNQVIVTSRDREPARLVSTISGFVTDSLTGEWITGATVLLSEGGDETVMHSRWWCPTNESGFFALRRIPPGSRSVIVRALGYRTKTVSVEVSSGGSSRVDFPLVQETIPLEEITIEGQRTALVSAREFSRGVYIRSTPSDQNQYLLDGARIYNPSHFGGVLSTFNSEAVTDVQVLVGGVPPYYGGRIGGIMDMALREGTSAGLSGSAGTGSLGSHLSLEGPISGATTFLASGRRGYPEVLVPFLAAYGSRSPLGSSEVIAKLTHRLSGSSRLFVSGYFGRDATENEVDGGGGRLNNHFSWGNGTLNLRWLGIASPSMFLHASAVFTRYDFSLEHAVSGLVLPSPARPLTSTYAIEDVGVRAHAEHYYDDEHTVRGGVELVHHRIRAGISEFSTQTWPLSLQASSTWDFSVYLQDQWRIVPGVTAEIGGRATTFSGGEGSFSALDPRFSMLVLLTDETRAYGSFTSINQFLHPYRSSGVFLFSPVMFWYPSSERARPSTSLHMTLGIEHGTNDIVASAEAFYRVTRNVHDTAVDTARGTPGDLLTQVLLGTGRAYGAEFSLRKRTGDVQGSLIYTLSWGSNTFAELNGGAPFAPRFDRRHELQIEGWYAPDGGWTLGLLCVLASDLSETFEARVAGAEQRMANEAGMVDVNGSRLPGFQRLEMTVRRNFTLGGLLCQLSLRMLNGYGLLDPFRWEIGGGTDVRRVWRASLEKITLFPLFPTVGVTIRF